MKKLKLYTSAFIILYLTIITGCSDNPVLTKTENKYLHQFANTNPDTALVPHSFNASLKLNPGQTLYLNYNNTLLIQISRYSISNCISGRNELLIQSLNFPGGNNLPCEWDCGPGLLLENLSIKI